MFLEYSAKLGGGTCSFWWYKLLTTVRAFSAVLRWSLSRQTVVLCFMQSPGSYSSPGWQSQLPLADELTSTMYFMCSINNISFFKFSACHFFDIKIFLLIMLRQVDEGKLRDFINRPIHVCRWWCSWFAGATIRTAKYRSVFPGIMSDYLYTSCLSEGYQRHKDPGSTGRPTIIYVRSIIIVRLAMRISKLAYLVFRPQS